MMRLTGQKIFDVTQLLARIIDAKRPLPGKGAYRVVKMHTQLLTEFNVINGQRTEKINSYGHKAWVSADGRIVAAEDAAMMAGVSEQNVVPDDKMPEFVEWWKDIAVVESDVNIEPIPIDQLCIDGREGSITFAEFQVLGDLVAG